MTITTENLDGITVITMSGDIDGKTAPDVQQQLLPLIEANDALVLDMHGVNYMSSAGLRVMLLLYRQAASQDSQLALVNLAEEVEDVMSATGFLDFFAVASDVPSGIAKLKGSA
jgi:anti-sigma B factor antagonist